MEPKFARKSDGLHARVCKDTPPAYQKKVKKAHIPASSTYHPANLRVMDKYALALLQMYPDAKSVGSALLKHIKMTVKPIEIED